MGSAMQLHEVIPAEEFEKARRKREYRQAVEEMTDAERIAELNRARAQNFRFSEIGSL